MTKNAMCQSFNPHQSQARSILEKKDIMLVGKTLWESTMTERKLDELASMFTTPQLLYALENCTSPIVTEERLLYLSGLDGPGIKQFCEEWCSLRFLYDGERALHEPACSFSFYCPTPSSEEV